MSCWLSANCETAELFNRGTVKLYKQIYDYTNLQIHTFTFYYINFHTLNI